jgi:hypothetical protein
MLLHFIGWLILLRHRRLWQTVAFRILHQGMLPELHSTEDQDDEPEYAVTSLALEQLCPELGQKEFWACYSCYFF